MKTWQILRDCRLEGDGVHHAVPGIACLHNLDPTDRRAGSTANNQAPTGSCTFSLTSARSGSDSPRCCHISLFAEATATGDVRAVSSRAHARRSPVLCPGGLWHW